MPTRRSFLLLLSGLLTGFSRLVRGADSKDDSLVRKAESGKCELTTEAVDGPFYVHGSFVRSEISDDRPGVPLILDLRVVHSNTCEPISGAKVDVWHCDAAGYYSGFPFADPDEFPDFGGNPTPTTNLMFCRGRQITDEDGKVTFQTIFPGWYRPRTVHIHLKAFLNDKQMIGTQLYFPQDLNDAIHSKEDPYKIRGTSPMRNYKDNVIKRSGGSTNAWPVIAKEGGGFRATQMIAVKFA